MTNLFNKSANEFDPNKNYLEELVGEDKKFKDIEALARGKAESDAFIRRLEAEQEELRKEYLALREEHNAVPKLQELLDRLEQQNLASSDTPYANEDNSDKAAILDEEKLNSLFDSAYERRKRAEQEEQNLSKSISKLKERYGEDYQRYLRAQSQQLGMAEEEVNRMAKSNPEAFARLFAPATQTETFEAPPHGSVRNDNFAPKNVKRNWSYYENLRKENPELYWSPKTQNQMHQDVASLGDDFDS